MKCCILLVVGISCLMVGCGYTDCSFGYYTDEVCVQNRGDETLKTYATYEDTISGVECHDGEIIRYGECGDSCILYIESVLPFGATTQYYAMNTGEFVGLTTHISSVGSGDVCPNGTFWPIKVSCGEKIVLGSMCED